MPCVSEQAVSLTATTTHYPVADIERLPRHLRIDQWLVFGGRGAARSG
jgi:hypothetical protein